MNLSEHFTLAELTRSDVAARLRLPNKPGDPVIAKLQQVCHHILEPVRLHFGRPVRINSGYRSPRVNAVAGGSETSQHCRGEAVDFEVPGVSNADVAAWVRDHLRFDQLILECYRRGEPSSGWVHVSWKAAGNRQQALTFTGGRYLKGLRP